MSAILRAFVTERIKAKRTLALYLSVIGPVLAVAMGLFSLSMAEGIAKAKSIAPWQAYLQSALVLWCAFVLPLVIALQAALMAQLEHTNHKWKHLLSLPVSRASLFLGKWLWLVALAAAANALFLLGVLTVCAINGLVSVANQSMVQAAWYLCAQGGLAFVCSLLLIAVQHFVSVRWASFAGGVSLGFVGTIVGIFVGAAAINLMSFFPWSMAGIAVRGGGASATAVLFASILGTICVLGAGAIEFGRRQVES